MVDNNRPDTSDEDETLPPIDHTSESPDMGVVVTPEGANLRSEGFTGTGTGSTSPYEPTGDLADGVDGEDGTDDNQPD